MNDTTKERFGVEIFTLNKLDVEKDTKGWYFHYGRINGMIIALQPVCETSLLWRLTFLLQEAGNGRLKLETVDDAVEMVRKILAD